MEDVLAVYQRPYDPKRPQVCLDEIQKALRSTPRGSVGLQPGSIAREDYEYKRHGKCALFLAVEPLAGRRHIWVRDRRTKLDCADVLRELVDVHFPEAEKIVLVMDNLNTHKFASLYEALPPEEARRIIEKLEIHYTPKHGSCLNMAEIELSVLHRQCLQARIPDRPTFTEKVSAWERRRNAANATVHWRFTTKDARIKLHKLYPSIDVS